MPTPPESFDGVDKRLIRTWDRAAASPPLRLPACHDESAARALREHLLNARRLLPRDDERWERWYTLEAALEGKKKNVIVLRIRNDPLAILDQIEENIRRRQER